MFLVIPCGDELRGTESCVRLFRLRDCIPAGPFCLNVTDVATAHKVDAMLGAGPVLDSRRATGVRV